MTTLTPPRSNAGWLTFLNDIQANLEQTLAATDAAATDLHAGGGKSIGDRREYELAILSTKFNHLHDRIDQADAIVNKVEEALSAAESALKQYNASDNRIREKLVTWTRRA